MLKHIELDQYGNGYEITFHFEQYGFSVYFAKGMTLADVIKALISLSQRLTIAK